MYNREINGNITKSSKMLKSDDFHTTDSKPALFIKKLQSIKKKDNRKHTQYSHLLTRIHSQANIFIHYNYLHNK